jgi:hypothetical protein
MGLNFLILIATNITSVGRVEARLAPVPGFSIEDCAAPSGQKCHVVLVGPHNRITKTQPIKDITKKNVLNLTLYKVVVVSTCECLNP